MPKSHIHIGTSGWAYYHAEQLFYPEAMPSKEYLAFYSKHFPIVEVNTTFYHMPRATTIQNWNTQTGAHFQFAIKASRSITHMKKLHDCKESLTKLFETIAPLKKKLGPILFQLPPSLHKNIELLAEFLPLLPKKLRFVIEFRHASWYDEEVYALLKKYKIALCISDLRGKLSPLHVTTDFTYIRLHGPRYAYRESYTTAQLTTWKKRILAWQEQNIVTYCFFDNTENGYDIQNALQLQKMLHQTGSHVQ